MRTSSFCMILASLLLSATLTLRASAVSSVLTPEAYMNLTTLGEAASSAFVTLGMTTATAPGQSLPWSGTYSGSDWTYSTSGIFDALPLTMGYVGSLTGTPGQNIISSFTGTGTWGTSPITIQGNTTWYYDPGLNDYFRVDFQQLTEIGTHSLWGWIVGAEIVVGGTIGAVGGIVAGAPATPAGSVAVGTAGALGGAGSAGTISEVVRSAISGDPPPPRPGTPTPPGLPEPGGDIFPEQGRVNSANSPDGRFLVENSDFVRLSGNYANGTIVGTVVTVPEPQPSLLPAIGFAALAIRYLKFHRKFIRRVESQHLPSVWA